MKHKYGFVLTMLLCIAVVSLGLTAIYEHQSRQMAAKATDSDKTMTVVTSFYPMYIAVMNVIGDTDGVLLENLSEPQTGCLHDYQLTPTDMKLLSTADLFVVNGGGIESFLSDVADAYPQLTVTSTTDGVPLIGEAASEDDHDHASEEEIHGSDVDHEHASEADTHTSEDEHTHASDVNAHAWMNMEDYKIQVSNIAAALCEKDPENKTQYEENAAVYCEKIDALISEAEKVKSLTKGKPVVIFHEAYAYVAQEYGMEVVADMDLDEERQISAGEVADILNAINEYKVPVVLAEELYGKSMGDTVEKEADVSVLYMDPLTRGDSEADSYLTAMKQNIELLRSAYAEN